MIAFFFVLVDSVVECLSNFGFKVWNVLSVICDFYTKIIKFTEYTVSIISNELKLVLKSVLDFLDFVNFKHHCVFL